MMMMCLKYRVQKSFFGLENLFFWESVERKKKKTKLLMNYIKEQATTTTTKKEFCSKKNFASIKCWRMRAETLFCMISANEFFFLFLLFHLDGMRFFRVCRMDGGRKKGMKRYRRQIIISDCQCYMGEWMFNKSKYHVEKRFSVRSFPRRFSSMHRDIHSESIYWIFMRSQCNLLKYDEIRHQFVLW